MTRGATWKVSVYGAEHGIPHFHIEARRARCTVGIRSLKVIIGEVASRDLREAMDWARDHQTELLEQWHALNR